MSEEMPVRGMRVRRRPGQRRASAGFSPRRALAALVLLAAAGAVWGVIASPVFGVRSVQVDGAVLTGEAAVRDALGLGSPVPNAFVLGTDELRRRLLALPAVADAEVSVGLPGTIHARVTERHPVLAWHRGTSVLLVDRDGRVVADASDAASAAGAAASGLPVVNDRRAEGSALAVGDQVDPIDLDVATRLLSLVPGDVGSAAPGLMVGVDDRDGWTVVPTAADPWLAVFGFYGTQIRNADMIPEQVRTLRSLLAGREAKVLRVVLAGEREGTFVLKPSP